MKNIILLLAMAFGMMAQAQNNVYLDINHLLGGQSFAFGVETTSPAGDNFNVMRLEYYLSEITVIYDGGQDTTISDLYMLVNANNPTSEYLGSLDVTTIEGVKFGIGVNSSVNHLDPASYPMSHPLAPKSPSMHWGWASGYRFLAIEGKSGTTLNQTYEIHALGDGNYDYFEMALNASNQNGDLHIVLDAEYANILKNFSVSSGPISHGETGISALALNNMQNSVFSANQGAPNGVNEIAETEFRVYPNPAHESFFVENVSGIQNLSAQIISVQGSIVETISFLGQNKIQIHPPYQGVYFVKVFSDQKVISVEKLVVY